MSCDHLSHICIMQKKKATQSESRGQHFLHVLEATDQSQQSWPAGPSGQAGLYWEGGGGGGGP